MAIEQQHREGTTEIVIRPARAGDLPRLVEIYNHYVVHTPITFDLDPVTVDGRRRVWFAQFADRPASPARRRVRRRGHRLRRRYAYQFRTSGPTTPPSRPRLPARPMPPDAASAARSTTALFDAIADEDIHIAIAGITVPNDASIALHERFGFVRAGLIMHAVGRKFDRYWDVAWYERPMGG